MFSGRAREGKFFRLGALPPGFMADPAPFIWHLRAYVRVWLLLFNFTNIEGTEVCFIVLSCEKLLDAIIFYRKY